IRGTTDSEWIYALIISPLSAARAVCSAEDLVLAVDRTLAVIRDVRAKLNIATSSSVNLFLTSGDQLAAVRYCCDFGCYGTEDPAKVHEANLSFLSLWYTSGREYGYHSDEWKMVGGSDTADSLIIASEPLTRDTSTWLEVPEYSMVYADTRKGVPGVEVHYLEGRRGGVAR